MTDKEFFEGEEECPVYGEVFPEWWCKECLLGTDGTAICPFRKMAYQQGRIEMENKIYTAQEMRAESAELVDMLGEHNTAASMLRYAADLVERCEKKRKELDEEWFFDGSDELTMPMEDCYEIIDYILRGDAGKDLPMADTNRNALTDLAERT